MAKILMLDDDRMAHKIVEKIFEKGGHQVLLAETCAEAWAKLREHVMVDLVVLDNQLKDEWGWQFMLPLRHSPLYKGLPVVVYTAQAERDSARFYIERGVQNMRLKPYQADVLLGELEKAQRTNWPASAMELGEVLRARLGLDLPAYRTLLESAAKAIGEQKLLAQARFVAHDSAPLLAVVDELGRQFASIGLTVGEVVVFKIRRGVRERDLISAADGLRTVDALLGMISVRLAAEQPKPDAPAAEAPKSEAPSEAAAT
jgi:twitching motility two-component system response regulator PilH